MHTQTKPPSLCVRMPGSPAQAHPFHFNTGQRKKTSNLRISYFSEVPTTFPSENSCKFIQTGVIFHHAAPSSAKISKNVGRFLSYFPIGENV